MGTYEQVKAMELSQVYMWYEQIIRSENACLTLTGAVNEEHFFTCERKVWRPFGRKKENIAARIISQQLYAAWEWENFSNEQ